MPSVWGVMSTRIGPTSMPAISPPWTAAPMATARSGSISAVHRPAQPLFQQLCISGVRVAPPTSTTLSIWLACTLASVRASSRQVSVFKRSGRIMSSYSYRGDLHHEVERTCRSSRR